MEEEQKEKERKEIDSQTRLGLENILRIAFHPTGARQLINETCKESNLTRTESKIQLGIATSLDIAKYLPYFNLAYKLFC